MYNIREMCQNCVTYINHRRLQCTHLEQRWWTLSTTMVEIGKSRTVDSQSLILARPVQCSLVNWNEVFHVQACFFDMRHNMLANLRADFWLPAAACAFQCPVLASSHRFDISQMSCTSFYPWLHNRLGSSIVRKCNRIMWSGTYYHDLDKLLNPWRQVLPSPVVRFTILHAFPGAQVVVEDNFRKSHEGVRTAHAAAQIWIKVYTQENYILK